MSVVDGHILQIVGDRGDNSVVIAQVDDQSTVTGDGSTPITYTGIDAVRVNTWAGDDSVSLTCRFTSFAQPSNFSFALRLGAGNDTFQLSIPRAPEMPPGSQPFPKAEFAVSAGAGNDVLEERVDAVAITSELSIELDSGAGDDMNTAILLPAVQRGGSVRYRYDGGAGDDMNTAIILPAVQRGGKFSASFDGGAGRDVLTGFVEDPNLMPGGMVDVSFLGGRGDDRIDVRVDLTGFTPESGQLRLAVDGGPGSDHMTLLVAPGGSPRMENAQLTLDGGAGEDFGVVSPSVDVSDVEHKVVA